MLLDESPGLERDGLMGLPWTAWRLDLAL